MGIHINFVKKVRLFLYGSDFCQRIPQFANFLIHLFGAARPECEMDSECPDHQFCSGEKCENLCNTWTCGENAVCKVKNHKGDCECPKGYEGDPSILCQEGRNTFILPDVISVNIFQSKFYLSLSHIFLAGCPDRELENVRNKAEIMAAGWNLDLDSRYRHRYIKHCGTDTFWGYEYGSAVGTMSYVFKGHGRATLKFGNCYNYGVTKVYLNDKRIGSAKSKTKNEIILSYKPGDTLKLTEAPKGIIIIYSLMISCNGKI